MQVVEPVHLLAIVDGEYLGDLTRVSECEGGRLGCRSVNAAPEAGPEHAWFLVEAGREEQELAMCGLEAVLSLVYASLAKQEYLRSVGEQVAHDLPFLKRDRGDWLFHQEAGGGGSRTNNSTDIPQLCGAFMVKPVPDPGERFAGASCGRGSGIIGRNV